MGPHTPHRNDEGFSFVQMIVTMVIGGILLTTVGFAAFSYIQQARETVLESNIRTAAEAVRNTLALNPGLRQEDDADGKTRGAASARLISELSNAAGFTWQTPKATANVTGAEDGWLLQTRRHPRRRVHPDDQQECRHLRQCSGHRRGRRNRRLRSRGGGAGGSLAGG